MLNLQKTCKNHDKQMEYTDLLCSRAILLFYLAIFGIIHPSIPPNSIVIARIGNRDFGSFQPINIAQGSKMSRAIKIPSIIG